MSATTSGAPKVTVREIDLSGGVAAPHGAFCGMVIPAPRGPIDHPVLISNELDLVRRFSPATPKLLPQYDLSFWVAIEALSKTNALWVMRAAEQPFFGGAYVRVAGAMIAGASDLYGPAESGFIDPDHYDLTTNDGRIDPGAIAFTADSDPGNLMVQDAFYQAIATGDQVIVTAANIVHTGATASDTPSGATIALVSGVVSTLTTGMVVTGSASVHTGSYILSINVGANSITLNVALDSDLPSGTVLTFTKTAALPLPLQHSTTYYVIKDALTDNISLATSALTAAEAVKIAIVSMGIGDLSVACAGKSITSTFTMSLAAGTITVSSGMYDLLQTGDFGKVSITSHGLSDALPAPLLVATDYYIYKTPVELKLVLCTTLENAQNGVGIELTDVGTGHFAISFASVTETTAGQDKALLIYGADPGAYNNNISITLINYVTNPVLVKEPGAFIIQVYYNGVAISSERWLCSFDQHHKDGNNQAIYILDVLAQSYWIRAAINPLLDPSIMVADIPVQQALSGGTDGQAVADGTMTRALQVFANTSKFPVNFLIDSGWATPAYQIAVISMAETIGTCVALIAPPYQTEANTDAVNQVVAYYQNLGSQSNHAGIFTSHLKVQDFYNNRQLWISPVGDVLADYSYVYNTLLPGQPVGGIYGPISAIDALNHWTDAEMDLLYNNNVNPIRFKQGTGIQIWGQKTLQSRPSDLDRLNARMVLMAIEPPLRQSYEQFLFSINSLTNDTGVRRQIQLITDGFMSTMQARGSIYDWKTICDSTNNSLQDVANETINVWLLVKIVKAVEYIPLTIGVTPVTLSFAVAETLLPGLANLPTGASKVNIG